MRTVFIITGALIFGSIQSPLANAQSSSTLKKKQTSDPYFSTPAQAAFEKNGPWQPPHEAPTSPSTTQSVQSNDVWKSLSRKTIKPIQRVDFSQLQVNPAVKADLIKTASSWQTPRTDGSQAKSAKKGGVTIDFSAIAAQPAKPAPVKNNTAAPLPAITPIASTQTITQKLNPSPTPLLPLATGGPAKVAVTDTLKLPPSPKRLSPLSPLPTTPNRSSTSPKIAAQNTPPQPASLSSPPSFDLPSLSKSAKPLKPIVASENESGFQSSVQQAAYQEPAGGSFTPGQNIKKIGGRIKQLAAPQQPAPPTYRFADSSSAAGSSTARPIPVPDTTPYQTDATSSSVVGESFKPSRVLALVGGQPIFVGDMLFEINQLIEKHMRGAPESAKEQQRENLASRLLPKYVDQKMLFIATVNQLPDGADIEDILKQAEKSFNEKALPDIMEKSGIKSTAQFDANLRGQGSSIRQMRRSWAKDQISRFFLSEKVQVPQDVTHQELIDQYRENYDSYANNAKCRWEKIEVQFARAGGRFAAKDKIEDIYQRLVHGGNFEAIAKKESHGFKAATGGQYDWTNRGSLVSKKIDDAIFTLPQGRLSEIIESKDAFYIVRVIERIDAHHTPFEEAQSKIKRKIIGARRDKAFKAYLSKLRNEIPVEYPAG